MQGVTEQTGTSALRSIGRQAITSAAANCGVLSWQTGTSVAPKLQS